MSQAEEAEDTHREGLALGLRVELGLDFVGASVGSQRSNPASPDSKP